jgi:hypothetical protein
LSELGDGRGAAAKVDDELGEGAVGNAAVGLQLGAYLGDEGQVGEPPDEPAPAGAGARGAQRAELRHRCPHISVEEAGRDERLDQILPSHPRQERISPQIEREAAKSSATLARTSGSLLG